MSNSLATRWTVAQQIPLSMRFPRQEYWSELWFPSPGDSPNLGIEPMSPAWQLDSLPVVYSGKELYHAFIIIISCIHSYFAPFCAIMLCKASLVVQMVKRPRFDSWVRKIPWKREWKPTPVFLPGESHGQRSLVGYSPGGCKEPDTTEQLTITPTLSNMFTYNWYLYKYSNNTFDI